MRKGRKWHKKRVKGHHAFYLFANFSIGTNMLIYNSKKVNSKKIEEKIKKYEETSNIMGFVCPYCGGKESTYYGNYRRNVIEINEKRVETTIKIKRLKCRECGKTHAVIPTFLIPYKQHTVETVNEVLKEKIVEEKTSREIEESTGVTRQLLRKWLKELEEMKGKLEILFLVFVFKELMKEIKEEKGIIEKYYNEYKEIYMLGRRGAIYILTPT